MRILAIDPGTVESAFVLWNPQSNVELLKFGFLKNETMLEQINDYEAELLAIEMVASYGMSVGETTFETVFWIGRFWQASTSILKHKIYRKDIKMYLCHSMRAKDANIRQALIDKYGDVGTKKNPGKLYGVSKHIWAALAVADYAANMIRESDYVKQDGECNETQTV